MNALQRRPEIVLVAITFIWGSTFIVTKQLVTDTAPLPYLAVRFCLASGVLFLLVPRAARADRRQLVGGFVLGLGQSIGLLAQVFAQVYTTASKTAFITALSTALTPLVGYLLYRDRPRAQQVAGVTLASIGLVALTWPTGETTWNRGDLLSLVGALAYAWVIVETPRRARTTDVATMATLQAAMCAVVVLAVLAAARIALRVVPMDQLPELLLLETRPFEMGSRTMALIGYMAIVCTVVTLLGQTWAMSRMSATQAAVVFSLEPVFATGLAIAVEGGSEWPGKRGAVGALLILAGLLVAEVRQRSEGQSPT